MKLQSRDVGMLAKIGVASLLVAFSGLAHAQVTNTEVRVEPASKVAAENARSVDPLWRAARYGRWDEFNKQIDLLAAEPQANKVSVSAAILKTHIAQRETDRAKRIGEVREELTKQLNEPRNTINLAKLLRSATELQVLSIDKAAVMADPQIREIVAASRTAAHDAENNGDVFGAYELFNLLGTLMEESGEYKPDVRRLSQRLDMLRLYVPQTLWKLRNDRQKAAGEKELPPYNPFGDEYQQKLGSIDASLVLRALGRASTHVEQKPINGIVIGGLEALRTMITTTDLQNAFPKLADAKARGAMLAGIEDEVKRVAEQARPIDLVGVDAMLARLRSTNEVTVQIPFYALLHEFGNGAMGKLDEFSAIIWPDELRRFQKMTQSSFVGVGIQIEYDESSNVRVVSPLEGTPAQRAGVHPGDVLSKVDGRTIFGLSLDQAVDVITGPPGTDVVLTMQRKSETEKDEKGEALVRDVEFRLTRAVIKVPTAKGWERAGIKEDDWNWFIDKDSGIGYIRLTQFADNTGKELDDAVNAMRKDGLRGLIFDLRFNPGGLLDQAVRIGRRFVDSPDGYIVAMRGPDGAIVAPEETIPERARLGGLPVVVLINEGSASASEIVSGALKCFQREGELNGNVDAVVLGARSYGKGSVQNVWPLTSDSAIKITTQYYVIPNGSILHRRPGAEVWGVEPNFRVEMLPKQTVDALLLRRNADVVPVDENGQVMEDKLKPRPKPQELLDKGLDLQLQAALVLMQSRIQHGTQSQQAVKQP